MLDTQPGAVPDSPLPIATYTPSTPSAIIPQGLSPAAMVPPRRPFLISGLVIGLLLIVGGGVAYAYVAQIGPFAVTQYDESAFVSSVLEKAASMTSASYAFTAALAVSQREKDAVVFAVAPANPDLEKRYHNDYQRIGDLSYITSGLNATYGKKEKYDYKTGSYVAQQGKPYPTTLSVADMEKLGGYGTKGVDPVTKIPYHYSVSNDRKNFSLSATLETPNAVSALKDAYGYVATTTLIDGQKATFTKDSTRLYIPSSIPKPFLVELADGMRSIPPDVSGDIGVGATADFGGGRSSEWKFNIVVNGNFGDLSFKVDAEALRKDKTYYVRVNKIPSLFGDFSSYKGQWISISPEAASSSTRGYDNFSELARGISSAETDYKENRTKATTALRKVAALADKNKLIKFKSAPKSEKVDGRSLYRYELTLNKETLIPFYKDVLADEELRDFFGIAEDASALDYLASKEFDETFNYLESNTFLTLWTDHAGYPGVLQYRLRIVPPDTAVKLADKQINLTFKVTFNDINKKVQIEAPADAKPVQTIIDEIKKNSKSDMFPNTL